MRGGVGGREERSVYRSIAERERERERERESDIIIILHHPKPCESGQ